VTSNRTFYANQHAQLLVSKMAANEPVLIANNDILNPLYVGESPNTSSTSTDVTQVAPLGAVAFGSGKDWYGATDPTKTAQIFIMPGATSWSPSPAQISAQLNALGLAKDTSVQATTGAVGQISGQFVSSGLYDVGVTNLPDLTGPGADQPVNLTPVNQVSLTGVGLIGTAIGFYSGYEIAMQCLAGATAIAGCCRVTLTFYNKVTDTIPVATVKWVVPSNNPAVNTVGNGPMHGNFMAVQIASLEPSTVANVTVLNKFSLTGSLRQTQNDNWQADGVTFGANNSSAKAFTNEILIASPSVGAGLGATRGILLYAGKARMFAENPGATGTFVGSIQEVTGSLSLLWHGAIPQNGTGTAPTLVDLILPREPVVFGLQNSGAAAGIVNVFITADRV
jgi:hypothetical protein